MEANPKQGPREQVEIGDDVAWRWRKTMPSKYHSQMERKQRNEIARRRARSKRARASRRKNRRRK